MHERNVRGVSSSYNASLTDLKAYRFGGSGTTANTFVYLVWATAQQPDIIRRLQEELDKCFPDTSTISDYLVWIILLQNMSWLWC